MRPVYLISAAKADTGWPAVISRLAARTGLAIMRDAWPLAVLTGPQCAFLEAESGLVLGTVFHRHGPGRALEGLNEGDRIALDAGPITLQRQLWGGYVAAWREPTGVRLMRDPSGALPCYLGETENLWLAASDVDLLLKAGARGVAIDWLALAHHLHAAGLPDAATALAHIRELMPGFCIAFAEGSEPQPCWSPWDHVGPTDGADGADPERLRRIVEHVVCAWTRSYSRLVLSLSGGLDSSIVAACLGAREGTICVNLFAEDAGGDERIYARSVAQALGLDLIERPFRIADVDLESSLSGHLPRPFGQTHTHSYERVHREVALASASDAFVTGNGGDNVFGHSQSAAAITDRFLARGVGGGALATLRDVCRQTGCSIFDAMIQAARIGSGTPRYRWRPCLEFIHRDMLAVLAGTRLRHPWLEAPAGALPGKAGHIAGLLRVMRNLEPARSRLAPVLNPLLSQPIIEHCLSVPSWEWRSGGIDRSLARAAFAQKLPAQILRRRTKGGPDGFATALVESRRDTIRERLVEGMLAGHGLLDVDAIQSALSGGSAQLGEQKVRLLELLEAEAWARLWSNKLSQFAEQADRGAMNPNG